MWFRLAVAAVSIAIAALPAHAEIVRDGSFTAARACPALQSFKKGTNPGNVTLTPGETYGVLAIDTDPASYVYITVPGANPVKRWVEIGCGTLGGGDAQPLPGPTTPISAPDAPANGTTRYILAVSWQPAFCEGHARVPECRVQTGRSPSALQLSLHGLWPQPRDNQYCNVSAGVEETDNNGDWADLPAVTLSSSVRTALDTAMPGTQSFLERHEWIVHGTCYGTKQERYFSDALAALSAVNASPVRDLFAANIGRRVSRDAIRAAFDDAFGRGAGDRVRLACDDDGGRRLISELTIGLADKVATPDAFGASLRNAAPTDGGCDGGIVDPAGLQ